MNRIRLYVFKRVMRIATQRSPDVIIGGATDSYLLRWHLIPRNPIVNVYLHRFMRSDDDRALHDHPWANVSWLLNGSYIEHNPRGKSVRLEGSLISRGATRAHRIELITLDGEQIPVWTLFITGPRVRQWGFHCPNGWRHWRDFTSNNGTTTGKGCD